MIDVHLVEVGLGGVDTGTAGQVGAGGGEREELHQLHVGAVAEACVRVVGGAHLDEGEADGLSPEVGEESVDDVSGTPPRLMMLLHCYWL